MDENDILGCGISQPPRNTAKKQLPAACVVRKSSHGRAKLFLEDSSYMDMRCSSSITMHQQKHSIFHTHGQNARIPDEFLLPSKVACYHCCHRFDTVPIPIPKEFDASTQRFTVYGTFCSFSCCKRFLCDTVTFDSGLQMLLLAKMAREVYGYKGEIQCAPPRFSLDLFGGPYTIERFRGLEKEKLVLEHSPPFVCAYHVLEERDQEHNSATLDAPLVSSIRGLRRMEKGKQEEEEEDGDGRGGTGEGEYDAFLREKKGGIPVEAQSIGRKKQAEKPSSSPASSSAPSSSSNRQQQQQKGTLAAFMVKQQPVEE